MASKTAIFKRVVIKTLLLTLTGLILAIFGQRVAFAADNYPSQTIANSTTTLTQIFDQTFTGATGLLTKIKIKMFGNDNNVVGNSNIRIVGESYVGTPCSIDKTSEPDYWIFDWECRNYTFNSGKTYRIIIAQGDAGTPYSTAWHTNQSEYPNGDGTYAAYGENESCFFGDTRCSQNLNDIYFVVNYVPIINEIEITFPENATSTPDFNYWGLSGNTLATSTLIHINWGISTSTWTGFTNYILDNAGEFSVSAPKSFTIPIGTYYAIAWLTTCPVPYDLYADCIPSTWDYPYGLGLLTPLATSTQISFTITGENPYTGGYYGTYYPTSTPTATTTSAEWVITCDPNDPLWQKSLCQIAKWTLEGVKGLLQFLFVPKQEDLAKFGELKGVIETKPPIGYFYAVKSALTGIGATSTPAFTLENASTTLADPIYNPLRSGITFVLWLLFGFWIFNRIRNLAL